MLNARKPKILVVDDDVLWLEQVPIALGPDVECDCYETIDQGIEAIEKHFYDVVLLDMNFAGDERTGLDVFRRIHAADVQADVIVISGETDHRRIIEIFNAGVTRFIPKMSPLAEIRQAVADTLHERELRFRASKHLLESAQVPLIGNSPKMQILREEIAGIVASGVSDVLIQGETGTGKELVAKALAYQADTAKRLVVVHCGAISEGLAESEFFGHVKGAFTGADRDKIGAFESAAGGFVFLDEIGELPLSQQPKLLRVLQERTIQQVGTHVERKIKFRCIAATHVNLEDAVKAGKFREDLYYRIAKTVIRIPSLRERSEDIPEMVYYFLRQISGGKKKSLTPETMAILQSYNWPGNVRQLKAVIESICAKCDDDTIREKDICRALPEAAVFNTSVARSVVGSYGTSLILSERQRYEKAIIKCRGNRDEAAKILGVSRATFFRRAKDLGLVKARGTEIN